MVIQGATPSPKPCFFSTVIPSARTRLPGLHRKLATSSPNGPATAQLLEKIRAECTP